MGFSEILAHEAHVVLDSGFWGFEMVQSMADGFFRNHIDPCICPAGFFLAFGDSKSAEDEEMGDSENCHPGREWLLLSGILKMTQKRTWFVTRPYEGNFMACWLLSGFWRLENARNREHDLFRNATAYMRCPAGFFLLSPGT
jgi:hypothetical protein